MSSLDHLPQLPEFDILVALSKTDPKGYEEVRRQLLRSCIDDAPEAHRPALERLYERIELVHSAARTPMEAVTGASRLMLESCAELREAMNLLVETAVGLQTTVLLRKFRL
ncbi:MAG: DUF3135 domain-containing protein [Herminiimonas sp.]|nr:DUF3135 domain-containing protein [Herminiimonas sp.]